MNEIKAWLNGPRDFQEGKKLLLEYYDRYLDNPGAIYQITNFQNEYSHDLLVELISEIYQAIADATTYSPLETHMDFSHADTHSLPEDLQQLADENKLLYKKRDELRYSSRLLPSGPSLHKAAIQIVGIDQRIRKSYSILDYFTRTGQYPPDFGASADESDIVKLLTSYLRAMKSFPAFISRNKDKPNRAKEVAYKKQILEDINQFLEKDAIQTDGHS
jgi:hypothetical protein